MSTQGKTWSKDPGRDKVEDIVAVNLDVIEELIRLAEVVRSQNMRVHALRAGQMPLTTRAKTQKNSALLVQDAA